MKRIHNDLKRIITHYKGMCINDNNIISFRNVQENSQVKNTFTE